MFGRLDAKDSASWTAAMMERLVTRAQSHVDQLVTVWRVETNPLMSNQMSYIDGASTSSL